MPLHGRFFIGRQCQGIEPGSRLVVDDESVSRDHLEIRLDVGQDRAYVVDTSQNGTRLNGARIERAVPVPLLPGDRIMIGTKKLELEFRSDRFLGDAGPDWRMTVTENKPIHLAMVVGDIVQFSSVSEYTDVNVLMLNVGRLYGELLRLLRRYKGRLSNFVGDAFFAIWELDHNPSGVEDAVDFALAADELVMELSPNLELRDPDGRPLRMGWAVADGLVAVSTMSGVLVVVLGDSTNLAFRLASLAGRDGRPAVLVTESARDAAQGRFRFEGPSVVTVKGRTASERIYEALGGLQRGEPPAPGGTEPPEATPRRLPHGG